MKTKCFVLVSALFTLLLFASPAYADHTDKSNRGKAVQTLSKVTEDRFRSCQAREEAIKTRLNSLIRLADGMQSKFDRILTRVQNYYTEKVLPSGKTLPNYDQLLTNIQNKKIDVQTALNKAKDDVAKFNCQTSDPKTFINQFRINMQNVKTALKNYRSSINSLIVAVKGLVGETKTTD